MQYRCKKCGETQWRGYFPREWSHIRYALFHGTAIAAFGIVARSLAARFGWSLESWQAGLVSLTAGLGFLLAVYFIAVGIESWCAFALSCNRCQEKCLRRA